jgi:hypothetical protein
MPYARYCFQGLKTVLMPGESTYESVFISAGQNGWDLADPGYYTIQTALHLADEDVVSNELRLRIIPPASYEEEYVAQDFFSDTVGRIMTFDGSRYLERGNDVLRDVTARLADKRVAVHAQVALGAPLAQEYKLLEVGEDAPRLATSVGETGGGIRCLKPSAKEASAELSAALVQQPDVAAQTLGHIDYKYYADRYAAWLADQGESKAAADVQDTVLKTLSERGVLDRVLKDVQAARDGYQKQTSGRSSRSRK